MHINKGLLHHLCINGFSPDYGDLFLRAERSEGHEVSLTKEYKNLKLSSTYFNSEILDKIAWDLESGKYKNTSTVDNEGMEYSLKLVNLDVLQFWDFSYIVYSSKNLQAYTPADKFTTSFAINHDKFTFGTLFTFIGEGNRVPTQSYLDFSVNYEYSPKMTFYATIQNIADNKYELVTNSETLGRSVYLGLKQQF